MIDLFIVFLVVSLGLAALARDPFIFAVLYLFSGAYILGRWWSRKAIASLTFSRKFDAHVFIGDRVSVQLKIRNTSRLPLLWARIQESLPVEISRSGSVRRIISFSPRECHQLSYLLEPRYRGYYPIGPAQAQTSDLLGFSRPDIMENQADYIYVFPKIIPLRNTAMSPSSPLGNLKSQQPIFEDPSRPIGKRNYIYGDSQRRIDWKSSASSGRLQVKLFEPSVDMQLMILLNLNEDDYKTKFRTATVELAITAAASIAYWSLERKIVTGLAVNGLDTVNPVDPLEPIVMNKGRAHLVKILEVLSRAKIGVNMPLQNQLQSTAHGLGWGTTLVLITGSANGELFQDLYFLRRRGINIVLIVCGDIPNHRSIQINSRYYGVSFYHFIREADLDIWRQ